MTKSREERLDEWIDAYCALFPFSGTVSIQRGEEKLFERCEGYANLELGIPVTTRTRFRLYSLTKPFCAISLLLLYDRGLVDLDAHPSRYISEAAKLHPGITVRSLLNHSSGLPDFSESQEFVSQLQYELPVNPERLIGCLHDVPMHFEPGQWSFYCNFNFFLVSLIAERVSDRPYNEWMEQEVFTPLEMGTAKMDCSGLLIPDRASGYDINGEELVKAPLLNIDWMMGAGCGTGTAADVYRIHDAIKREKLLKKDTWGQVLTPSQGGYGFGCTVSRWHGRLRYTHNGGFHGFRTLHIQLPEDDFDIILLSNYGFGNARIAFSEAIYSIYYGPEDEAGLQPEMDSGFARSSSHLEGLKPHRPEPVSISPGLEEEYKGFYRSRTQEALVSAKDGRWTILLNGRTVLPVYPCAKDMFFHTRIDESYTFVRNGREISLLGMDRIF